jgi:hypothetical protein
LLFTLYFLAPLLSWIPRPISTHVAFHSQDNTGSLPWTTVEELQRVTHFDQVELEALYDQFKSLSTVDSPAGGIDQQTFDRCLGQ